MTYAPRVINITDKMQKFISASFFQIETSFNCSYPQITLFIFVNGVNRVFRKAIEIVRHMRYVRKKLLIRKQDINTSLFGANPYHVMIHINTADKVIVERYNSRINPGGYSAKAIVLMIEKI